MPLRSTARTYSQSVSQDSSLPESSSCGAASGRDPSVRAALGGREGREGEGKGREGRGREGGTLTRDRGGVGGPGGRTVAKTETKGTRFGARDRSVSGETPATHSPCLHPSLLWLPSFLFPPGTRRALPPPLSSVRPLYRFTLPPPLFFSFFFFVRPKVPCSCGTAGPIIANTYWQGWE